MNRVFKGHFMRRIPLAAPGFVGELFWLLAHPTMAVFAGIGLSISFALGCELDHILPQMFLGILIFHGGAQAQLQIKKVRFLLLGWVVGCGLFVWGSWDQYHYAGQLNLAEGQSVESYQRGMANRVSFHLGQPLSLKKEGLNYVFQFGKTNEKVIEKKEFLEGEPVDIGLWTLSYLDQKIDGSRLSANLSVTSRKDPVKTFKIRLSEGESISPDGHTSISVLEISPDRQKATRVLKIGGGVKLLIRWADGFEQGWHYLNVPTLHSDFGQAPLKVKVDSLTPANILNLRVQLRQHTLPWMWLGLLIIAFTYMYGLFVHFNPSFMERSVSVEEGT